MGAITEPVCLAHTDRSEEDRTHERARLAVEGVSLIQTFLPGCETLAKDGQSA